MKARRGSYRWYLERLNSLWYPKGEFDFYAKRFHMAHWKKQILLMQITETRELLDELEAKLESSSHD